MRKRDLRNSTRFLYSTTHVKMSSLRGCAPEATDASKKSCMANHV